MKIDNAFISYLGLCLPDFKNIENQAGLIEKHNVSCSPFEKGGKRGIYAKQSNPPAPFSKGGVNYLVSMIILLLRKIPGVENPRTLLVLGIGKPNFDFLVPDFTKPGSSFPDFINFSIEDAVRKEFSWIEKIDILCSSCVTGLYAVYHALQNLEDYDRAIILCAETSNNPLTYAGYKNMGVLSKQGVMRPFSLDRDGFVPGSGAGLLVIDNVRSDALRGTGEGEITAKIKAIILRNDAGDLVHYKNNGELISDAIKDCLAQADLCPGDIDYINVHGTATKYNDLIETQAIKKALGWHAREIPVSSTKPFTGHCLSASGLIETIISFISLENKYIFPTMNCSVPDPACDLDYVFNNGREKEIRNFLKISLGFGGNIGILIGGK